MITYQHKGGGLLVCPYCSSPAEFHEDSSFIYGKNYGAVYTCSKYPVCDSYIGVHKGTDKPLGRLANKELRQARIDCHWAFDRYWRSGLMTRKQAYKKLAQMFGKKEIHIGEMKLSQCKKLINNIENYFKENTK